MMDGISTWIKCVADSYMHATCDYLTVNETMATELEGYFINI